MISNSNGGNGGQKSGSKPVLFMIDDLHIGDNFNIDVLQFLKTI